MKKLTVCLTLFFSNSDLLAPPKNKKKTGNEQTIIEQVATNNSSVGDALSPTEEKKLSAKFFTQNSESDDDDFKPVQRTSTSHASSHFIETAPTIPKTQSEHDIIDREEVASLEQKEEQIAQEKRTLIQSAILTLKKLGALEAVEKTQDFTSYLTQTRLKRILNLDDLLKLRKHLETFESETDQGEWLSKGLAQAIEAKKIDDITRMLEIIQNHNLTNFVPTQHQEEAAQILLEHTRKTIATILPQAQRISKPGDVSPRSKAAESTLGALLDVFGETGSAKIHAMLEQLSQKKASATAIKDK